MADEKSRDALLAALAEEEAEAKPRGPGAPEHLKKLVRMNPSLRPAGLDTEQSASKLADAMRQARMTAAAAEAKATVEANKAPPATTDLVGSTPAKPLTQSTNLISVMTDVKKRLADDEQQLDAQEREARVALEQAQKKIAEIGKKKTALLSQACDRVIDGLLAIDPNLTSPKTQAILQSEKPFLDRLGFSAARMIEREKKRK